MICERGVNGVNDVAQIAENFRKYFEFEVLQGIELVVVDDGTK